MFEVVSETAVIEAYLYVKFSKVWVLSKVEFVSVEQGNKDGLSIVK